MRRRKWWIISSATSLILATTFVVFYYQSTLPRFAFMKTRSPEWIQIIRDVYPTESYTETYHIVGGMPELQEVAQKELMAQGWQVKETLAPEGCLLSGSVWTKSTSPSDIIEFEEYEPIRFAEAQSHTRRPPPAGTTGVVFIHRAPSIFDWCRA